MPQHWWKLLNKHFFPFKAIFRVYTDKMATPTRWGVLGVGRIATDFTACIDTMPTTEHQVVAVAARQRNRAEKFAAQFDIPNVYDTYEQLMADSQVDVIYISTIHINHVELSLACIEAGKSVVCEKPMALSAEGCKKVLEAAKRKGVLFVEGFWTRFFPATKFIKEQISSGDLGDVRSVQVNFHVPIWEGERINKKELGGGGLMDIGCYTVQWANLVFKGRPESITSQAVLSEEGVDKQGIIILKYPGDKFVTINYNTTLAFGGNSLYVRGTKANLIIPEFQWCPDTVKMQDGTVKYFQLPQVRKGDLINLDHSEGFCYEIQAVRNALLQGEIECPEITHEDSETINYILTEVQKQIGVTYDFM